MSNLNTFFSALKKTVSPAELLVQPLWSPQSTLMKRTVFLKKSCKRFPNTTSTRGLLVSLRGQTTIKKKFIHIFLFFLCSKGTRADAPFCSARHLWVWVCISLESTTGDGEAAKGTGGQKHPGGQGEAGSRAGVGQAWASAHANETR